MIDPRRRALLRGRIVDVTAPHAPAVQRPPWALHEEAFTARCVRCHACVDACPRHVIRVGDGGFPAMEFFRPLAGSSASTVVIFVPLAFLSGVTGAFFKALALTMAAALVICGHGQLATMAAKESLNRSFESGLSDGVMFERRLFHSLFATADQKEGMDAFLNKRPPVVTHR